MDTSTLIKVISAVAVLVVLVIAFLFYYFRNREKKLKTKIIILVSLSVVVIGYIIALLLSGVINVSGTGVEQSKGLTAIDYVNAFKNAGLPVENIIEYNEENDTNNLLGRPGQYISKVSFADTRIDQYDKTDPLGGTVEVFNTHDDLQSRREYIETVQDTVDILPPQYFFVSTDGLALLRVESDLTPDEAAEYEKVLLNIDEYLLSPNEDGVASESSWQTNLDGEIQNDADFRDAYWGMSFDDIIKSERGQFYERTDDSLHYYDKEVSGLSASVSYQFDNGKLISGMYSIDSLHSDLNDYIDDYNRLKQALISKYGDPSIDTVNWKDDQYRDDPKKYGQAIAVGDLEYCSQWNVDNGDIVMIMSEDFYNISLTILYRSKDAIAVSGEPNTDGL